MTDHENLEQLKKDVEEIRQTVAKMADILEAWNNARGFVNTLAIIGKVAKWLVAVGAAFGAIWLAFKHGVKGD